MNHEVPQKVTELGTTLPERTDGAFIVFASPETRCLGSSRLFKGYKAEVVCVLVIADEPNNARTKNVQQLRDQCKDAGPMEEITVQHADVVFGIDKLIQVVRQSVGKGAPVTVDISTFPKNSLLVALRAIDRIDTVSRVRLVYTEPGSYRTPLDQPLSYGLRNVEVVPTYVAPYQANEELVLVMFLGYERDRAIGMWQRIQPHQTVLAIAHPPYHPEWKGTAETLNAQLLAAFAEDDVHRVDPRNPIAARDFLRRVILPERAGAHANFFIAPTGTKPQAVGVYLFCKAHPQAATVVYAQPVEFNHAYLSSGVGPTWLLPCGESAT